MNNDESHQNKVLEFAKSMNDAESGNAIHFDTLKMVMSILKNGYDNGTKYPLKSADVSTLMLVAKHPNKLMNFYSFRTILENGSFTYVANKLVNLGLIEIVVSKEDKRKKALVLTDEGMTEVLRLREVLNKHLDKKISKLTDEERMLFLESMAEIRNLALKMVD